MVFYLQTLGLHGILIILNFGTIQVGKIIVTRVGLCRMDLVLDSFFLVSPGSLIMHGDITHTRALFQIDNGISPLGLTSDNRFFSTYLGISSWIIGMSLTKASTASLLNQTTTIFILIFARLFLDGPITKRRVFAILIAMAGAYLVFIG